MPTARQTFGTKECNRGQSHKSPPRGSGLHNASVHFVFPVTLADIRFFLNAFFPAPPFLFLTNVSQKTHAYCKAARFPNKRCALQPWGGRMEQNYRFARFVTGAFSPSASQAEPQKSISTTLREP